jgi:hypothetical protein
MVVKLANFQGFVVDKLIDFYYGNRIQNGNLRVLARANSLSPTKGWGPFSRDVKSDYYYYARKLF